MIVALLIHGTGERVDLPPGRRLLAVDAALLAIRPRLAWSLGLDAHEAIDDALVALSTRDPLLVLGPRGLDERAWVGALDGPMMQIDLDRERLTAPQAAALFADRSARVVFRATDAARARRALDSYATRVRTISVVPLHARPGEAMRILESIWRNELHAGYGLTVLGDTAVAALGRFRWPRNVDELREYAPRLLAYHQHRTISAAARTLGIARTTLEEHLERVGVWAPRGG